jgi:lysophospholipase L1-like esterase
MFPELPDVLARRSGGAVTVCTIGFKGRNTAAIVREFDPSIAETQLGGAPTNVVILTGVNDQVQRRGPRSYVTAIKALMDFFPAATGQVISAPLVNTETPLNFRSSARRVVLGLLHPEVNAQYRKALSEALPAGEIIDFSEFSAWYTAEPARYEADGIHITRPTYREYGAFIGERVNLAAHAR